MQKNRKQMLGLAYVIIGSSLLYVCVHFQEIRLDVAMRLYEGGVHYKVLGWPGGARLALELAERIGSGAQVGLLARRYRCTKIPRYDQSPEAIGLNIHGYHYMVGSRSARKDLGKAEQVFKECIRRFPNFEWPYNNLSNVLSSQKRFSEARKYALLAVDINPNYVNAYVNLAFSSYHQGDVEACKKYALKAFELDPDDPSVKEWKLWHDDYILESSHK